MGAVTILSAYFSVHPASWFALTYHGWYSFYAIWPADADRFDSGRGQLIANPQLSFIIGSSTVLSLSYMTAVAGPLRKELNSLGVNGQLFF